VFSGAVKRQQASQLTQSTRTVVKGEKSLWETRPAQAKAMVDMAL